MSEVDERFNSESKENKLQSELSLVGLVTENTTLGGSNSQAGAEKQIGGGAVKAAGSDSCLPALTIDGVQAAEHGRGQRRPAAVSDTRYPGPDMHAPELAGDRQTSVQQHDGVRTWSFESGSRIIQHSEGAMAGAQMLQDSHGRTLRWQEPSAADGGSLCPRREIEFQYPAGDSAQNRNPEAMIIRNVQTGEIIQTIRADQSTQITVGPDCCRVVSNPGDPNQRPVTTDYNFNGTETSEIMMDSPAGPVTLGTMRYVVKESTTTADGIVMPQGSVVTVSDVMNGSNTVLVQHRDGRSDIFSATSPNVARSWDSSQFASPQTLQYNVNGQQREFSDITSSYMDRNRGMIILNRADLTSWELTLGQNGTITSAECVTAPKPQPKK